jgi:hypothetical protein
MVQMINKNIKRNQVIERSDCGRKKVNPTMNYFNHNINDPPPPQAFQLHVKEYRMSPN